ncbi:unnamed protein product [Acanthoscelides obtectus]|uniref:Uncharacterized protein n=1 Tax=Acanthoscelides obtectus TaxID=200917 RepID=A0A9P0M8P9_ACAOB|nr:unnamed protein product [Acanthoscelides obtectus]CAK1689394.1 hypothetical protein AOBTE_LOCUS37220 [Acanthoscelides obtectus]
MKTEKTFELGIIDAPSFVMIGHCTAAADAATSLARKAVHTVRAHGDAPQGSSPGPFLDSLADVGSSDAVLPLAAATRRRRTARNDHCAVSCKLCLHSLIQERDVTVNINADNENVEEAITTHQEPNATSMPSTSGVKQNRKRVKDRRIDEAYDIMKQTVSLNTTSQKQRELKG